MKSAVWLALGGLLLGAGKVHADPLDDLAAQLAKGATQLKKSRTIAVLTFTYPDGAVSTGSSIVAEGLTTKLVGRKRLNVVERSQLYKILAEQKLALTGVIESSGPQKLGQILGVDALVTGTLADLAGNRTLVNARLVESVSGKVISAASTEIDRTWEDAPRQPPTTDVPAEVKETRYMSPLIPVHRGPYNLPPPGRGPVPRRRPAASLFDN